MTVGGVFAGVFIIGLVVAAAVAAGAWGLLLAFPIVALLAWRPR